MEEKKGIFDYLGQVFLVFGVTLFVIAILCYFGGEEAKGYSTVFALGREGIPLKTVFEYLLSSVCVTFLRFVFFSDILLKKMCIAARIVGLLVSVVGLIGIFAFIYGWFPVDEPKCWAAFFVCFAVCFSVSLFVSVFRERRENKKFAEGLRRVKEDKNGN